MEKINQKMIFTKKVFNEEELNTLNHINIMIKKANTMNNHKNNNEF